MTFCNAATDGVCRQVTSTLFLFNEDEDRTSIDCIPHYYRMDMISLKGDDLSMQPDRIWTGTNTIPLLERYFDNLVCQIRDSAADQRSNVLELLPNVVLEKFSCFSPTHATIAVYTEPSFENGWCHFVTQRMC